MICTRCQGTNPAEMRFCGHCGAALSSPSVPPSGDRRQITVLFCDLVGSTELSSRLDPEDLGRVLRAYHDAAGEVIRALDGHIAQYLGDGLLVYFGYPVAHEDSAARAVRAGLRILAALRAVNPRVQEAYGADLHARVGVHTGLALVDDVGGEARQERLAVGETPNIAARAQGLAATDTVYVTESTWRLVHTHFEGRALGPHTLKGISHPVALYEALAELDVDLGAPVIGAERAAMVGRDEASATLLAQWAQARGGGGPVALLTGEPGIGKSRQVQALRETATRDGAAVLAAAGEAGGEGAALQPVVALLRRRLGATRGADHDALLARLREDLAGVEGDDTLALLATLLSIPAEGRYTLAPRAPQRQRADTFEAILRWLGAVAARGATLVVLEDLHWADPSTVELAQMVVARAPTPGLLLLLTARPSFRAPWIPASRAVVVTLERLGRDDAARLVAFVAGGRAMPAELVERILERAEGVPLFLEEVTRSVLESDRVRVTSDRVELRGVPPRDVIPATVQDSLLARLDRLGPARALAQLAAVVGHEFDAATLRDLGLVDDDGLRRGLAALVEANVVERDATVEGAYAFRHVLFRDAAYQSLPRAARRRQHDAVLRVLLDRDPDLADRRPELLARHYEGAGLPGEALELWRAAGASTSARSAFLEAESNFRRALEQLDALPPSPERDRREVALRTGLGLALVSTQGFATRAIEENYARASELCARATEVPFAVLIGVWSVVFVRGDRAGVDRMVGQLRRVAETTTDPTVRLVAHQTLASRAYYSGRFREAQEHRQRAIDALAGRDPREVAQELLAYGSEALLYGHLYRGIADAARGERARALEAVAGADALAEATGQPYMRAVALCFGAGITTLLNEPALTRDRAARGLALAAENALMFWIASAKVSLGWAQACLGEADAGAGEVREGIGIVRAIGAMVVFPLQSAQLGEALLRAGRFDEGLAAVDDALAFARAGLAGEATPPDLAWVRGALLAARGDLAAAEAQLRAAIALATAQEADGMRARAEAELARLTAG
jgi:class 3 adenylate cyclase/tetratricopeptide (TPR) repeat protein